MGLKVMLLSAGEANWLLLHPYHRRCPERLQTFCECATEARGRSNAGASPLLSPEKMEGASPIILESFCSGQCPTGPLENRFK